MEWVVVAVVVVVVVDVVVVLAAVGFGVVLAAEAVAAEVVAAGVEFLVRFVLIGRRVRIVLKVAGTWSGVRALFRLRCRRRDLETLFVSCDSVLRARGHCSALGLAHRLLVL